MLFCHLNVRSLYSCMDDIQDLLNCDCGRVFFSLSETWLNDSIPDGMVAIPGFTLHRKDRSEHGGGVAMYCPDGFRCYRRSDLEVDALEVLWTEVKVHRGKSVLVCSVYRSPTGGCFGNFVEQFSVMLENAVLEGKEIIVLGDLNVNLLVDSPANRHMTSVCRELKLTQMISVPTRITENSRTLIDHVYVTNPQGFSESGCIDVGISDHLMVFTIKKGDQSCGHKIRKARSFKRCEVDAMLADLKAAPWKCDATDINHRWSHWKEVFLNVVDRHAPIVSCRIRRDTPPWLSSDCRKLMKKRNRIHRLAMRTGSSDMWDSYRCLKNRVTGAVRGAKRTYFESLMSSTSGPTGRMWRQINRLLGKVNSGGTVLSGENFVQSFCDHLTMVTEANVSSDAMLPLPTLMKWDSVFHLQPVQEDDVLAELCGLNITKATGLDNISARLLRLSAPAIAASLCDLYNFSISACQIPKEWKEAKIIPIPKSANAGVDVEQFRPNSILPIVSKVLESLIHSQVYSYIQEAGILNEVLSGFRHGYCAQDALLRTVDDWRSGLDENKVVGVVFVDLRKAFDSIDHGLLLRKLAQYGIAGSSLKWFECYLSERRQRVVVGYEFSRWVAVRSGVPQGSILGPLLFNIFVNDLPDVVQTSKIMLYADDTTLYYASSCMSEMKEVLTRDLQCVSSWIEQNRLKLNVKKTQWMCLARKNRKTEALNLDVKMNGEVLQQCKKVKYLGVTIDNHLCWKDHIEEVRKKCFMGLIQLSKLRRSLPSSLKKLLYLSLVQPHLDYCSVVWADCTSELKLKLDRIQKWGMRIILNRGRLSPSEDMRRTLGWMTLSNRRRMLRAKVVKRCLL